MKIARIWLKDYDITCEIGNDTEKGKIEELTAVSNHGILQIFIGCERGEIVIKTNGIFLLEFV